MCLLFLIYNFNLLLNNAPAKNSNLLKFTIEISAIRNYIFNYNDISIYIGLTNQIMLL